MSLLVIERQSISPSQMVNFLALRFKTQALLGSEGNLPSLMKSTMRFI